MTDDNTYRIRDIAVLEASDSYSRKVAARAADDMLLQITVREFRQRMQSCSNSAYAQGFIDGRDRASCKTGE